VSKSSVSRICAQIDVDVTELRTRRLDHQDFVYVWLDATYVHVRHRGQVVSMAVVIATGLRTDGHREILGVDVGDSENETFWTEFLRDLRDRGLSGVRLVISDAHAGLKAAIRRVLGGAAWQRCRVHAMRNLLAVASHTHRSVIAALIRTIFAQPDAASARAQLRSVVDQLNPIAPAVGERLEAAEADLLAYTGFPAAHWPKIWSNNPIPVFGLGSWKPDSVASTVGDRAGSDSKLISMPSIGVLRLKCRPGTSPGSRADFIEASVASTGISSRGSSSTRAEPGGHHEPNEHRRRRSTSALVHRCIARRARRPRRPRAFHQRHRRLRRSERLGDQPGRCSALGR
jgi:hypothetical protein